MIPEIVLDVLNEKSVGRGGEEIIVGTSSVAGDEGWSWR